MELVIPLPPSKNASHELRAYPKKGPLIKAVMALQQGKKGAWFAVQRAIKVGRQHTDAYTDYIEELERVLSGQGPVVLEGDVRLQVIAYFPDRRRDMANIIDVLLDALQGVCYTNDRQVKDLRVTWALDPHDPRCVVRYESLQADLFAPSSGPPLQMEF